MPRRKGRHKPFNNRLPGYVSKQFITELLQALPDDGPKSAYLREEILSKYCDSTTTPANVRRDRAVHKWLSVEHQNARTNWRLYCMDVDFGWITSDQLIDDVKSLIARILGPLDYPSCVCDGNHTNGASTRVRRGPTAAITKLTGEAEVSDSALKHWLAFASGTRLSSQTLKLSESSKLFTVPKKSDIDRVAAKEPEINMLLQRSVGGVIRRRLKRVGVDLNDQTINQRLAQQAVALGLATVDLSAASDSVTRQLVIRLLPFEWWSLLDDLRVKSTLIDGTPHELEMFSSMGNGFTFELESLLFYAITRVVCWRSGIKGRISVYGDDIIAPSKVVRRLARVFHFLGFKMNPKKTNYRGPFRESCGGHYWNGFDISPFYIRREVSTVSDLVNLLNRVLEWDGRGWGFFVTPELARFHRKWAQWVPARLHGGIDPNDPTCLVTGDRPRHRLVPKAQPRRYDVDAGLTYWLVSKRQTDETLSLDPRIETGFTTKPIIHLGARTTWCPYLLEETTHG